MYLVDSNVWLERLLDQTRSEEVGHFLDRMPSERLFISDFTFHSIAVILCRLNEPQALLGFVHDTFVYGAVVILRLQPEDTERIVRTMERFQLDFEDAYQYVAAANHGLTLVSFDHDFDRTERGRKTPEQIPTE